jgi:hypothetical protein
LTILLFMKEPFCFGVYTTTTRDARKVLDDFSLFAGGP